MKKMQKIKIDYHFSIFFTYNAAFKSRVLSLNAPSKPGRVKLNILALNASIYPQGITVLLELWS